MALAKNTLIFLAAQLLALLSVCCGAVYKVGDSSGWTSLGSVDYQHWASTKTFHVGDTIGNNYINFNLFLSFFIKSKPFFFLSLFF